MIITERRLLENSGGSVFRVKAPLEPSEGRREALSGRISVQCRFNDKVQGIRVRRRNTDARPILLHQSPKCDGAEKESFPLNSWPLLSSTTWRFVLSTTLAGLEVSVALDYLFTAWQSHDGAVVIPLIGF